jgi:hypothetical protein
LKRLVVAAACVALLMPTVAQASTPNQSSDNAAVSAARKHRHFCEHHRCIPNFWNGHGYIVRCRDGMWSHSGGRPGACSYHGGVRHRTVVAPVSAARACGGFRFNGFRYHVTVERGTVSCSRARRILRRFFAGHGRRHNGRDMAHTWADLGGWRCGYGTGGGGCTKRQGTGYILAQS